MNSTSGTTVRVFSIDNNSGNLTNVQESASIVAAGQNPGGQVVDPSGKVFYVVRYGGNPASNLLTYRVNEQGEIGAQIGTISAGNYNSTTCCGPRFITLVP